MPEPTATWNPARGVWETAQTSLYCSHSALYSETWPRSGSMRNGSAFARPTSAPPTSGNGCSSSPGIATPRAAASRTSRTAATRAGSRSGPSIEQAVEIAGGRLPREFDSWEELPPSWQVGRNLATPTASLEKGGRPQDSHGKRDLRLDLLPTPTATPYGSNQSPSPAATVRPSLQTMATQELLPTPVTTDARGTRNATASRAPGSRHHDGMTLTDALWLLPTPIASDANGPGQAAGKQGGADLRTTLALLPTPTSRDDKGRNQRADGTCLHGALTPPPSPAGRP